MKTVLANGVFDIFHFGHLLHLREAREMGDRLVVALTVDEAVNKGHGRPINKWQYRAAIILELRCVDEVLATASAVDAIYIVKPQIFVKGIDYKGGDKFTENIYPALEFVGAELRYTETPKLSADDTIKKALAVA
jgi:cytidyltransferase-like protein